MSKLLETKKKILSLLSEKEMTRAELSEELELTPATLSQHLEELQKIGAVKKFDDPHFRKLKYYRTIVGQPPATEIGSRSIAPLLVVASLLLVSVLYVFSALRSAQTQPQVLQNATTISPQVSIPSSSAFSPASPVATIDTVFKNSDVAAVPPPPP